MAIKAQQADLKPLVVVGSVNADIMLQGEHSFIVQLYTCILTHLTPIKPEWCLQCQGSHLQGRHCPPKACRRCQEGR